MSMVKALMVVVLLATTSCGKPSEDTPVAVAEGHAAASTRTPPPITGNLRLIPATDCKYSAPPPGMASAPCPSNAPASGTIVRIGVAEAMVKANGDFQTDRPSDGTHQVVVRDPTGREATGTLSVNQVTRTLLIQVREDFTSLEAESS